MDYRIDAGHFKKYVHTTGASHAFILFVFISIFHVLGMAMTHISDFLLATSLKRGRLYFSLTECSIQIYKIIKDQENLSSNFRFNF
jgi:hypothetical protein